MSSSEDELENLAEEEPGKFQGGSKRFKTISGWRNSAPSNFFMDLLRESQKEDQEGETQDSEERKQKTPINFEQFLTMKEVECSNKFVQSQSPLFFTHTPTLCCFVTE